MRPATGLTTALASRAAPRRLRLAVFTGQGTVRWGEDHSIAPAVDHKVAFVYASPTPRHPTRLVLDAPMPGPSRRTLLGLAEPDEASGWTSRRAAT